MSSPRTGQPINIVVADGSGSPYWEAKFRQNGRQAKRRIGPAWLVPAGDARAKPNGQTYRSGKWVDRQGRARDGALTYNDARELVPTVLASYHTAMNAADSEVEAARVELERPRSFRELAHEWREHLNRKGTKPSTLVGYDAMLAEPGAAFKRGDGTKLGHIMAALGDLAAADITAGDVEALLATVAETGAAPRTVEKYRVMVRSILNFGIKETKRATAGSSSSHGHDYKLAVNAAQVAEGPRQPARGVLIYYTPDEIEALARALTDGRHRHSTPHHQAGCPTRTGGECTCAPEYRVGRLRFPDRESAARHLRDHRDEAEIRSDLQDAVAVRVSAYTGLRLGELLALKWSSIDWSGSALTVSRSISAGEETAPKSGKVRRVALPDQAMAALEQISRRGDFTAPGEYVFCNVVTGRPLDGSALRRRYKEAQAAAGVHALRWHDLRHTYGSLLAASGEELVTIKAMMGHANISTTEVYLHARPATELANRFTRAFSSHGTTQATANAADASKASDVRRGGPFAA